MSDNFDIHVLAPGHPGSREKDQMDGIHITRYRYFFRRWENLAYQGGILAKLRQRPARAALIPFFMLGQLLAAARLQRRGEFDLLHAHWFFPQGMLAAMTRKAAGSTKPLVVTAHGSDLFALRGGVFDWMRKQIMQRSAAVTVVSDSMRNALPADTPDALRIEVIPMGVDLNNTFVPAEGQSEDGLLLYVGRLMESKGVGVLIRALPEVVKAHPAARMRIVGDGPERDKYRQLVERLGLQGRVEFTGALKKRELPDLYRQASVVVFPSVQDEGFGLVPVEALGCGCAVVASDLSAVREVITDGKTGLLVPASDHLRLAEAAARLLQYPQLRSKLGHAGRQEVLQRFDWSIVAGRYRDLIQDVIGEADNR